MKNAMQLKAVIKNIAKDKRISAQLVMQNYMLERLLERISVSEYQQNFILKGGFLISAMVGLDTRATMDMDVLSLLMKKLKIDFKQKIFVFLIQQFDQEKILIYLIMIVSTKLF